MQDWDTRIKNLKNDIQIAREKYVNPFIKEPIKKPERTESNIDNQNTETNTEQQEAVSPQEKLYVNNDPISSLDSISKQEGDETVLKEETQAADIVEEATTEEVAASDNNEVVSAEETQAAVTNEEAATDEVSTENDVEENVQEVENDTSENQVKKTELELLEERGEDNLSDEEVDRMYELRLLRSQKNMNNELREQEQEEIKKADEEIAHLKTLLKPKPKKLPKGYVE